MSRPPTPTATRRSPRVARAGRIAAVAALCASVLLLAGEPPSLGSTASSGAGGATGAVATAATTAKHSPSAKARCAPSPSACGYPDASNTGPRKRHLRQVPGQLTSGRGWSWSPTYGGIVVTGAGAVLKRLNVAGAVVIDAPHVTLQDSVVAACGGEDDSDVVAVRVRPEDGLNGSHARIIHNKLLGTPAGCDHRSRSGVRDVYGDAVDVRVARNDISGTGNGVTLEYVGVVRSNWVHDLGHLAGDHHSGISTHGGALKMKIRHNTVLLYGQQFPDGGGLSGAITVYSDFGHAQNTTITDNFISGGAYVIYGGNSGDDYSSPSTNIKIFGNRFVCGDWDYGPVAAFTPTSTGNEWSGNFCDGSGRAVRP